MKFFASIWNTTGIGSTLCPNCGTEVNTGRCMECQYQDPSLERRKLSRMTVSRKQKQIIK